MPHDQQHPMEQPLRDWAATRRQQAGRPFELHPADRARLQEDVARTLGPHAQPLPAATLPWRRFLPRLAFALGAVALLLLGIHQLTRHRADSGMDLARHETPAAPESSPPAQTAERGVELHQDSMSIPSEPAPSDMSGVPPLPRPEPDAGSVLMLQRYGLQPTASGDAPPGRSAPTLETSEPPATGERVGVMTANRGTVQAPASRSVRQVAPRPAAPAPSARPIEAPGRAPAEPAPGVDRMDAPTLDAEAGTAAVPAAPAADPRIAPALEAETSADTAEQPPDWAGEFVRPQAPRRNINAPPDYALRSFRVEQRGAALRLLDEDGSVYRGVIVAGQLANPATPAITAFAGSLLPPGSVGFRIAGTNRSAGKDLIFQGVLVTGATVRIQGQAILGGRDRIVVDAPGRAD